MVNFFGSAKRIDEDSNAARLLSNWEILQSHRGIALSHGYGEGRFLDELLSSLEQRNVKDTGPLLMADLKKIKDDLAASHLVAGLGEKKAKAAYEAMKKCAAALVTLQTTHTRETRKKNPQADANLTASLRPPEIQYRMDYLYTLLVLTMNYRAYLLEKDNHQRSSREKLFDEARTTAEMLNSFYEKLNAGAHVVIEIRKQSNNSTSGASSSSQDGISLNSLRQDPIAADQIATNSQTIFLNCIKGFAAQHDYTMLAKNEPGWLRILKGAGYKQRTKQLRALDVIFKLVANEQDDQKRACIIYGALEVYEKVLQAEGNPRFPSRLAQMLPDYKARLRQAAGNNADRIFVQPHTWAVFEEALSSPNALLANLIHSHAQTDSERTKLKEYLNELGGISVRVREQVRNDVHENHEAVAAKYCPSTVNA